MELSEIREKIDTVDDQLLKLFLERMDLAEEVAAYKNEHHLPILNKERERAVLARVTEQSGEKERYAYHLFSTLFELARSRQAELIDAPTKVGAQIKASLADISEVFPQTGLVACQGVEGANSQVASDRIVPRGNLVYVKTFQAVVSAVESGLCKFGVLPIENSTAGPVIEMYDLLDEFENYIVAETILPVVHTLAGLPGAKLSDISRVYSKTEALMQTSRFLDDHPDWQRISVVNTAVAAKKVLEENDISQAAVCSAYAADVHGLSVLVDGINDDADNSTRFIVVTNQKVYLKDASKISIRFELPHRSGSLYGILSHFIYNDLNMTRIESRPVKGRPWEYCFFVDFEGNLEDPAVKNAIRGLREEAQNLKILGNY